MPMLFGGPITISDAETERIFVFLAVVGLGMIGMLLTLVLWIVYLFRRRKMTDKKRLRFFSINLALSALVASYVFYLYYLS